jgi:hypothetical protein
VRFLLQVEQVHLRAQPAVVALGGFLQPGEVGVELLLVEPAGAVDAESSRSSGRRASKRRKRASA